MIPRNALLCTAMLATLAAPTALADEFQVSVGSEHLFDSSDSNFAFTGATARGAYFFNETFGIEAEGLVGVKGVEREPFFDGDIDINSQYGAFLVGRLPAGKSGEFFARAGVRAGSMDAEYSVFDTQGNTIDRINGTTDYKGMSFGAGYSHFFTDKIGVRGEVSTNGVSYGNDLNPERTLTSASISLVAKFGK